MKTGNPTTQEVVPAEHDSDNMMLAKQGLYVRGGVNLLLSNSSVFTPFAGAFVGYQRDSYSLEKVQYYTPATDSSIGNNGMFIFGAKAGAHVMLSESGFGLSVNYVFQKDSEDKNAYKFDFKDDAKTPNTIAVSNMKIKHKDLISHSIEFGIVHAF